MHVYLAARYSRRDEMKAFRDRLEAQGHRVIARWLETKWDHNDGRGSSAAPPEYREQYAAIDLEDVDAADCVISFTEPERASISRGGRHVEFGYALGKLKRCIVVGWRENLFHYLPDVEFFATPDEALAAIGFESP